jgi:prepilin-type N-terminal cleavage/methylation domain-containing protein
MKKGFTLIELVVAMAIFAIITTLAIGAFVSISKMKSLTSTMKETQQKTRIALEMMSRLAKQAEIVEVSSSGYSMDLYYNVKDLAKTTGAKFEIAGTKLNYYTCSGSLSCSSEGRWSTGTELYRGIVIEQDILNNRNSQFIKKGTVPPQLQILLYGRIGGVTESSFYSDKIDLNTTVILENIK